MGQEKTLSLMSYSLLIFHDTDLADLTIVWDRSMISTLSYSWQVWPRPDYSWNDKNWRKLLYWTHSSTLFVSLFLFDSQQRAASVKQKANKWGYLWRTPTNTFTIKPYVLDFFVLRSLWITGNWSGVAEAMLIFTTNHNGIHWRAVHEAMFKIRMRGEKRLYGQTDLLQVLKQKCTGDWKNFGSNVHTRTQAGYTSHEI